VLSKCANPACAGRFRYLHQGRIFQVETGVVLSGRNGSSSRKIEHFWLCELCAQILEVVVEHGAVTTRPLQTQLTEGGAQEKSRKKRNVA
jgi:hypothetical protein